MKSITIQGEPYRYAKADRRMLMYTSVDHSQCVVVEPGEYYLIDRHFRTYFVTEQQMDYYIRDDYARFRRSEAETAEGSRAQNATTNDKPKL